MKEEVISFETAKLAKEKKFPQDIFNTSWYNYFGNLNGRTDLNKNGEYVCESGYFQSAKEKANNKSEAYLAPRQSLLQKWLREEHNINVLIKQGYGWVILHLMKIFGFHQKIILVEQKFV